jgi:hypothetical protein
MNGPRYVSIEEAAQAVGVAAKTLRNWVSLRILTDGLNGTADHGLRRIRHMTRIELPVFCAAIERGELSSPARPRLRVKRSSRRRATNGSDRTAGGARGVT